MPLLNKAKMDFSKMRSVFFFSLIAILGIAIIYILHPFIYPIFWAAVIAMMFHPLYQWLHKHLKAPNLSSMITLILVIVIIFLPLTVISTLVINEAANVYQSVSQIDVNNQIINVTEWLQKTPLAPYVEKIQTEWLSYSSNMTKTVSMFLLNNIKGVTQNSLNFFFMLFIMFYTLFYFIKDGERILKCVMHLSPLGDKYETMLYEKFRSTSRATLKGTFIVGTIQGTIGGILFWLTGIQGALIWGLVMIAFSLIPAVGSSLIWFPTGIIMLTFGYTWEGLTILLVGLFVISTIDNLLKPILVGKDIQMHPLLVLFSTLGGIIMFGISGFVIGPVIAALFVAVMTIYDHHYNCELKNN